MSDLKPIYVRVCDSRTVFGISRSTVYEMAARGELTIYKSGGKSLLKVSEVAAHIEGRAPSEENWGAECEAERRSKQKASRNRLALKHFTKKAGADERQRTRLFLLK